MTSNIKNNRGTFFASITNGTFLYFIRNWCIEFCMKLQQHAWRVKTDVDIFSILFCYRLLLIYIYILYVHIYFLFSNKICFWSFIKKMVWLDFCKKKCFEVFFRPKKARSGIREWTLILYRKSTCRIDLIFLWSHSSIEV